METWLLMGISPGGMNLVQGSPRYHRWPWYSDNPLPYGGACSTVGLCADFKNNIAILAGHYTYSRKSCLQQDWSFGHSTPLFPIWKVLLGPCCQTVMSSLRLLILKGILQSPMGMGEVIKDQSIYIYCWNLHLIKDRLWLAHCKNIF